MADMAVDSSSGSIIPIVIKHQGKTYPVDVDTSEPGSVFKYQVYSLTSVQPENQKILCRAQVVKDETDMATLKLKPNQTVMVLGPPGAKPARLEAPKEKIRFVEDMSAHEIAQRGGLAVPVGLANLGNTCYLNASLQVMRAIPELQDSLLNDFRPHSNTGPMQLTGRLRDVFLSLAKSGEAVAPMTLLQALRAHNQRFAEQTRSGFYAQQDAEEAWTCIVNNLKATLPIQEAKPPGSDAGSAASGGETTTVIDRYLTGRVERVTVCDEEAGNTPDSVKPELDNFRMLDCHINESVNHLRDGLLAGLLHKVEKESTLLGRTASFTQTDRLAELPKYLGVHVLRFSWKRTQQVSTKILRKVTFPQELDITELCTDELRTQLVPIREKVREVRKDMDEMERSRKKRKRRDELEEAASASNSNNKKEDENKKDPSGSSDQKKDGNKKEDEPEYKTDAQLEDERLAAITKAQEELYELVKPQLEKNKFANHSGLYQLRAVLTHQGPRSDGGHYTAFVKKGTILNPISGKLSEEDGSWLWFNDDTVTEVTADRVESLAGGGPSHSAFILLYSAESLPIPQDKLTEKFSQS